MSRVPMVLLGLLLTAGCGGRDGNESRFTEDDITQRMTEAMVKAGSMHVALTIAGGGQSTEMEGDQTIGSDVKDIKGYAMDVTYKQSDSTTHMRLVDGIIYADLGAATDGKFLRVDPAAPEGPMGDAMAPLIHELDIATSVRRFEGAITEVEQEGDAEIIEGVKAVPYKVTIDVDRAIDSGALDETSGLRPGTSIDYTFFIDDDDLLRRMEFEVGEARARMDITHYGDAAKIVAPPADEVIDEGAL